MEEERPTKRRRLLMGLAQDVHPDEYRRSCRELQERCMCYLIDDAQGQHPCWLQKEELWEIPCAWDAWTGRVTRVFFRCLRCGRSHICQPPAYITCPRVTSPENPADYVCGYSGRQLENEQGLLNSGFNQQGDALAAMENKHGRRGGVPMGKQLAREFTSTANYVVSANERTKYRKLAGVVRKNAQRAQEAILYNKLTQGNTALWQPSTFLEDDESSGSSSESEERPAVTEAERLHDQEQQKLIHLLGQVADAPVLDDEKGKRGGDDDGEGGGGDAHVEDESEEEEEEDLLHTKNSKHKWSARREERMKYRMNQRPLMEPTYNVPPVVVPQVERLEDNAYLQEVLDPVADYLASYLKSPARRAMATTKTPSRIPAVRPPPPPRQQPRRTPSRPKNGAADKKSLWAPLHVHSPAHAQTAHQRDIVSYVSAFFNHYLPNSSTPTPLFAVFCDRLLWTYHHVTGLRHGPLWPMENSNNDTTATHLKRLLFGLLTHVLVQPGLAMDPASGAKIPVWLPHADLLALNRRGQLNPAQAPVHLLPRGIVQAGLMTTLCAAVLQCPSYSPHTLAAFLWPPTTTTCIDST